MNQQSLQDRVAQGAKHLDEVRPGWHKRISLLTLNIGRIDNCVLGQLEGSFPLGVQAVFNGSHTKAVEEGFGADSTDYHEEHEALTSAWKGEIRARAPRWSLRRIVGI